MIKTLSKVGLKRACLNIIKAIYKKPTANIILRGQKLKAFQLTWETKTKMSTFTTSIQHSIEILATEIRQEKEIKDIQTGKGELKLSLFADDMIVYTENPYRLHQRTTWLKIWIWQNSRIQSQYSEKEGILKHQQWNTGNKN